MPYCFFKKKKIEILSDGSPFRPLIHVKDMARALIMAVMNKDLMNKNDFNGRQMFI